MQVLTDFLGIKDLIPHGFCLSWSPLLLWLNVASDLLITLAYYSIPVMTIYFIRQRKDMPHPWLVALFAGFTVACGTTHLLSAITVWIPLYWLEGWLKALTAAISAAAALLILRVIPGALSAPSTRDLQSEIAQRIAAEEALRASNAALRQNIARNKLLLDSALDGIISMNHNGDIIGWDGQAEHIFGYTREQALGRKMEDLIVPVACRDRHRQGLERFLATGESHIIGTRVEVKGLRADGSEFPMELAIGVLEWEGESCFSAYANDISERKTSEEAVRQSQNKLETILDNVDAFIYIKDCDYRYQYANKAVRQVLGRPLEAIIGKSDEDLFDRKTTAALREQDRCVLERGERMASENLYTQQDRSNSLTYLTVKQPLRREDGSIYGLCGVSTDITERKAIEEKLRDSEVLNVSILNSLTSNIAVLDAQGVIIAVNSAWLQFARENGVVEPEQNMLGINYLSICGEARDCPCGDEAGSTQDGIRAVLDGKLESFHLEYPCHSPIEQRWFYMNVSPLRGSLRGVVVSHTDISERRKAEEAARAASQYARSLIEASLDPLVTINAEGKITDVNTATEQVTGICRADLIGSDFADYFTEPEKASEGYQRVFSQGFVTDYSLAIRHTSGKVTEVLYNASLYRNSDGNVLGVFAAARDITERKQIEAELIRSNAELEQFAYAVSHDMRQPLRMVSSYLSLIESALDRKLDEETRQCLDFAIDGSKRMDKMILSLLDYSRIGRKFEQKAWVSSKASLDEALAFLNPELNASGGRIEVTGEWPELFASRDELTRLLQNLIGNALKYHEENRPPQVCVHAEVRAGRLRVEIRDHGIGIDPTQLNRLFKVFSRLQARSRFDGTGVGLALCRKIVEHHDGEIGAESAGEGQGCTFWFELPISDEARAD